MSDTLQPSKSLNRFSVTPYPTGVKSQPNLRHEIPTRVKSKPNLRHEISAGVKSKLDSGHKIPTGVKSQPNLRHEIPTRVKSQPILGHHFTHRGKVSTEFRGRFTPPGYDDLNARIFIAAPATF